MSNSLLEHVLPGSITSWFEDDDLAELVVLQRCCWVREAIANDTLDVPALHETHAEVMEWATSWTTIVTRLHGRIVAAVRGRSEGTRWHIGRLMVAPDLEGRGVGAALLAGIEEMAPAGTTESILFTGGRSVRNIDFYERAGYARIETSQADFSNHIQGAVFMAKQMYGGQSHTG